MTPGVACGVFDSGVGGLSVVRQLLAELPGQPLVYLADQAHAPYGERELAEIRQLAEGISRFLLAEGARVIVVACNTASAAALHWLREEFPDVPFVGMEPAVKPAVERTHAGRVGVLATRATFQGQLFASLLARYARGVSVFTQVCPEWVSLVEAGEVDTPRARAAVQRDLAPLLGSGVDELVLGCTHYPFLLPLIQETVGPEIDIIDPAPAVARQTQRVLAQRGWLTHADAETQSLTAHRFYTTGDPDLFAHGLTALLHLRAPVGQARWEEGFEHLDLHVWDRRRSSP